MLVILSSLSFRSIWTIQGERLELPYTCTVYVFTVKITSFYTTLTASSGSVRVTSFLPFSFEAGHLALSCFTQTTWNILQICAVCHGLWKISVKCYILKGLHRIALGYDLLCLTCDASIKAFGAKDGGEAGHGSGTFSWEKDGDQNYP